MRIGLISDTHGFLDDAVFHQFAECDEMWLAGDFGTTEVLDRLRALKPVRGVYGNVDGAELRADLPEDLVWECEGLNVYMTHIGGYPGNYDRRAGKEVHDSIAKRALWPGSTIPIFCILYDVGPDYLVMEYVDGRPLKGPLPLEDHAARRPAESPSS
jgi:hypothetical protein